MTPSNDRRSVFQGVRRYPRTHAIPKADIHAPGFAAEAHRQSQVVAASAHAGDDQAFVDAASVDDV